MLGRQQLLALLNQLSQDLNGYLLSFHYSFVSSKNKALFEKSKKNYFSAYVLDEENERYLFVYTDTRNRMLSAKRLLNIIKLSDVILKEINDISINHKNVDAVNLKTKIESLYQLTETAIEKNTALSAQYAKIHQTFHQNRLLGMNIFCSWWNKTWFQSRAMVTLEKAHSHLAQFSKTVLGEEINLSKSAMVYSNLPKLQN